MRVNMLCGIECWWEQTKHFLVLLCRRHTRSHDTYGCCQVPVSLVPTLYFALHVLALNTIAAESQVEF